MNEGIRIENRERQPRYGIYARNTRGSQEKVGELIRDEERDVVEFFPNTEANPESEIEILENTFRGSVKEYISPDGEKSFHLTFPSNLEHLNLRLSLGIRRPKKNLAKSPPEILASMGQFGDEYWSWEWSEEQWAELKNWLENNLDAKASK